MYFVYNEIGKIMICAAEPSQPGMVQLETPPEFDIDAMHDWRVEDGALVYDPLPVTEAPPTTDERLTDVEEALNLILSGVTE